MKNRILIKKFKVIFLILILFIFASCSNNKNIVSNKIPIIKSVENYIMGAAAEEGKGDIKNSPYYKYIDFYNCTPTNTLIKLDHFKTYQQTTDYSCGACCALMILNYFNISNISEYDLVKEMDIHSPENRRYDGSCGATTKSIVSVFKNRGFNVTSSINTQDSRGISFESSNDFYKFITEKLNKNVSIIVENIELGGHWRVIIGYDDMGVKDDTSTHVLIFADPYDTNYHNQDGYTIGSLERFFYSWFDYNVMPKDQSVQQYACVGK